MVLKNFYEMFRNQSTMSINDIAALMITNTASRTKLPARVGSQKLQKYCSMTELVMCCIYGTVKKFRTPSVSFVMMSAVNVILNVQHDNIWLRVRDDNSCTVLQIFMV